MSRYSVRFRLQNIGGSPAINVELVCRVAVPQESGQVVVLDTFPERVDLLDNKKGPRPTHRRASFLFFTDDAAHLLRMLSQDKILLSPFVIFRALFRNTVGGCFVVENHYSIQHPTPEQRRILAAWGTAVATFRDKHSEEIRLLEAYAREGDEVKYRELFDEFEREAREIPGNQYLTLQCSPIGGSFSFQHVPLDEYEKEAWEPIDPEFKKYAEIRQLFEDIRRYSVILAKTPIRSKTVDRAHRGRGGRD